MNRFPFCEMSVRWGEKASLVSFMRKGVLMMELNFPSESLEALNSGRPGVLST
jgi:hypothetical protein